MRLWSSSKRTSRCATNGVWRIRWKKKEKKLYARIEQTRPSHQKIFFCSVTIMIFSCFFSSSADYGERCARACAFFSSPASLFFFFFSLDRYQAFDAQKQEHSFSSSSFFLLPSSALLFRRRRRRQRVLLLLPIQLMDFICYSWSSNCDIVKWWQLIFHWWKEEWQINLTHIDDYVSHILYKHYHVLWLSLFFSKAQSLALLNRVKYVWGLRFFCSCTSATTNHRQTQLTRKIVWLDSISWYH